MSTQLNGQIIATNGSPETAAPAPEGVPVAPPMDVPAAPPMDAPDAPPMDTAAPALTSTNRRSRREEKVDGETQAAIDAAISAGGGNKAIYERLVNLIRVVEAELKRLNVEKMQKQRAIAQAEETLRLKTARLESEKQNEIVHAARHPNKKRNSPTQTEGTPSPEKSSQQKAKESKALVETPVQILEREIKTLEEEIPKLKADEQNLVEQENRIRNERRKPLTRARDQYIDTSFMPKSKNKFDSKEDMDLVEFNTKNQGIFCHFRKTKKDNREPIFTDEQIGILENALLGETSGITKLIGLKFREPGDDQVRLYKDDLPQAQLDYYNDEARIAPFDHEATDKQLRDIFYNALEQGNKTTPLGESPRKAIETILNIDDIIAYARERLRSNVEVKADNAAQALRPGATGHKTIRRAADLVRSGTLKRGLISTPASPAHSVAGSEAPSLNAELLGLHEELAAARVEEDLRARSEEGPELVLTPAPSPLHGNAEAGVAPVVAGNGSAPQPQQPAAQPTIQPAAQPVAQPVAPAANGTPVQPATAAPKPAIVNPAKKPRRLITNRVTFAPVAAPAPVAPAKQQQRMIGRNLQVPGGTPVKATPVGAARPISPAPAAVAPTPAAAARSQSPLPARPNAQAPNGQPLVFSGAANGVANPNNGVAPVAPVAIAPAVQPVAVAPAAVISPARPAAAAPAKAPSKRSDGRMIGGR